MTRRLTRTERIKRRIAAARHWYWRSGAKELCEPLGGLFIIIGYYCGTMVLVIGGYQKLVEIRGDYDPITVFLLVLSCIVCSKGATALEEEGYP